MPTLPTLPAVARASRSTGVRLLASGALAVGLLSTAPATPGRAATAPDRPVTHAGERSAQRPALGRSARRVSSAATIAAHQKGEPYRYGAAGPNAFDCSGLTFYSFRKAGFRHMPRTSSAQAHFARHIKRSAMRRGDLIFFTDGGGVYHVGIYAGSSHGHRWVLHAPYSGARVRTEKLWTDHWFPGTLRYR
ncbi:C40 family peptidase [Nocardioides sp.]|uniref:C40 family peptidase n=1 Tax=Nocardioides sp. TaxID=35761 RepID=UPI0037851C99